MPILGLQGAYKVYRLRKRPKLQEIIQKYYENTVHVQGHMTLSVKKEKLFQFTNGVFLLFSAILLDLVSNVVTKKLQTLYNMEIFSFVKIHTSFCLSDKLQRLWLSL